LCEMVGYAEPRGGVNLFGEISVFISDVSDLGGIDIGEKSLWTGIVLRDGDIDDVGGLEVVRGAKKQV